MLYNIHYVYIFSGTQLVLKIPITHSGQFGNAPWIPSYLLWSSVRRTCP